MISPVNNGNGSPYPSGYAPQELDYGQREDVQEQLQQIADALDECDGMLQQGRNGVDGAGTAVDHSHDADFIPPVSSSEIDDSASSSDETSGLDALPTPIPSTSWPSDSEVGQGLTAAVTLALLLVAYLAEQRANGKLESQITREKVARALEEIANHMKTATVAQGASGIVGGSIGVGGAGASAAMLRSGKGSDAQGYKTSKIDGPDGMPTTTTKKVDITESDGQMDGMQASMDDFNQRRRDGGVDAAGNASSSSETRGHAGDPNGQWEAGLDGMPGMGNGNGRSVKGLAGDPDAAYGAGRSGAPGMDGAAGNPAGRYEPGQAGMPGMDSTSTPGGNGLAGNPHAKFGPGSGDMPGMDGFAPGHQGMAGDPQSAYGQGKVGAPGVDGDSGLAGNPQGVYGPGGANVPGMSRTSGQGGNGLAGDPDFDWNDAPTGRPGMPGMDGGSSNRSGRTGAGNGANGADIDIDVNQQRNGGISQDHMDGAEGAAGSGSSSHHFSSEEQTTGPAEGGPSTMSENWRQGWGQDPNAKTQQRTAKAQAIGQGTTGLGGLAGAGGGIGSGLAGVDQKVEEANIEREKATMDAQDSINDKFEETIQQLQRMAQEMAEGERQQMRRILG